jgi:hypothetical protein
MSAPKEGNAAAAAPRGGHWRRYGVLYLIVAVCIAPVVASYFAFYVAPPSGRTNYGTLITPTPPPAMPLTRLDGKPFALDELAGQWVMLSAAGGGCDAACAQALLQMRQQRLMAGKDQSRIDRVWLVIDAAPVSPEVLRAFDGTVIVRAPAAAVESWLGAPAAETAGHVFLVDPMGNLMMRWPREPEPQRVKKDLSRLLTASSHWVRIERKN